MVKLGYPQQMAKRITSARMRAAGLALLVTFLWSSSWVLIRWGLDDEALPPLMFAALRYCVAALVLLVWVGSQPASRAELRRIGRSQLRMLLLLGVTFYSVTQGASFVAINHQPAATTSLMLSLTPLLVAFVAAWTISESPTGRQIIGAATVVLGASAFFSGDLGATLVGMAAAVVALVANAVSAVMGRSVNRGLSLSPSVITAVSMGIGAVALLVAAVVVEGVPFVSGRAWVIIAWLAVVNTALAFTMWNWSLRWLTALESAAINNTMLIQIALLGWVFLDEGLTAIEIAGILLVTVGILLSQGSAPSRIATPASAQTTER